jgi:ATP-dependent Lon protease
MAMIETNLPVLYLRDVVLLPYNEIRLEFTEEREKKVLEYADKSHDGHLLLINLVDPLEESPSFSELPKIGILGKIRSKLELPNGNVRVVLNGIDRVEILNYVETSDIISGVVSKIKPTHIILIDSLCASAPERLGKSIQITNNGLCPGSGIGNKRKCIDKNLCKNIVSIGVPLLIYSNTFIEYALYEKGIDIKVINGVMRKYKKVMKNANELDFFRNLKRLFDKDYEDIVVSIKDIEQCVDSLSNIIAKAINIALGVDFE